MTYAQDMKRIRITASVRPDAKITLDLMQTINLQRHSERAKKHSTIQDNIAATTTHQMVLNPWSKTSSR
jgi:hypothetical protein